MSLPSAKVSRAGASWNSSDSSIWRRLIISRRLFGTSMPTVGLPGIRSMRIDSACRPRQRSSLSVVILVIFTPASGLNSKVVTTGPGLICATLPRTLNSSSFALMRTATSLSSALSYASRSDGWLSRVVEGSSQAADRIVSGLGVERLGSDSRGGSSSTMLRIGMSSSHGGASFAAGEGFDATGSQRLAGNTACEEAPAAMPAGA